MSGIAGYLGPPQPPTALRAMLGKMMHRGPARAHYHEEAPVYMGARQLNGDGAGERLYVDAETGTAIVLAGEFSNFRDEYDQLEKKGVRMTLASMAETALRLYQIYGVNCVNRMRGAFVFALHDPQKDLVFIARDPLGAMPLYYATTQAGTFVFASEIKALFEHPGITAEVDMRGVDAFLTMGCSPGPDAMFKGVHKLAPGHRILWNPGLHVMIEPYWQWESFSRGDAALKTDDDFVARFGTLFEDAVLEQAGRDPGVFLSGDVESAAIAAVLAKKTPPTAYCFDLWNDSGVSSAAVAAKLGCKAEVVSFGPHDMDKLPEAIWALDEPLADIWFMPLYLVSRFAQKRSGPLLTGAGASALFGAQPAQRQLLNALDRPRAGYSALKSVYSLAPQAIIARMMGFEGRVGPRTKQRLLDFVEALRAGSLWRQYLSVAGVLDSRDKQALYIGALSPVVDTFADMQKDPLGWSGIAGAVTALQQAGGLPDGVLAPIEKIGMFNSVETRAPFADHRLAEFLIGLPDAQRRSKTRDKSLLRNYMAKMHPGAIEPSFVPLPERRNLLADCLAAPPLKEMVETCLSEASIRRREIFEWSAVKPLLAGAKTDERIYARQVFALLSLELWFRIFVDHEKGWVS